MREPPQPGFTGTVWEAVPPEQLVREVSSGPGAMPMSEAGLAYDGLAAGLSEAAAEFRAVLSVLGDAWSSPSSADGLNQLAALAEWLDRTTDAARSNAALAAAQATACQIARTTVPHLADVDEMTRAAENLLRGSLVGPLLAGLLDTAEHQLDGVRQQAARAMREYESASERLAHPWQQDQAPAVSAAANLLAEQSKGGTPAASRPAGNTLAPQHGVTDLPRLDLSALPQIAPAQIPVAPTIPVGSEALALPALPLPGTASPAPAPVPVAAPAAQSQAFTTPLTPPVSVAAAQSPTTSPRAVASDISGATDTIVVNAGFATAPAVLGAAAPAAARSADPATPKPEY